MGGLASLYGGRRAIIPKYKPVLTLTGKYVTDPVRLTEKLNTKWDSPKQLADKMDKQKILMRDFPLPKRQP